MIKFLKKDIQIIIKKVTFPLDIFKRFYGDTWTNAILKNKHKNKPKLDPRTFLIMDDCMSSKHLWLKDPNILELFFKIIN